MQPSSCCCLFLHVDSPHSTAASFAAAKLVVGQIYTSRIILSRAIEEVLLEGLVNVKRRGGSGALSGRRGLLLRGGGPGGRVFGFGSRSRVGTPGSGGGWRFHIKVQGSARSQFRGPQAVPAANLVGRHIEAIGDEVDGISRARAVLDEPMGD
jgi:hypothetical protein